MATFWLFIGAYFGFLVGCWSSRRQKAKVEHEAADWWKDGGQPPEWND